MNSLIIAVGAFLMAWNYNYNADTYWAIGAYDSAAVVENAQLAFNDLLAAGWTRNAAIACIGNLAAESGLNPCQFEVSYNFSSSRGAGLGQWTPATKLFNYMGGADESILSDGDKQIEFLTSTPGQWSTVYVSTSGYSSYYNMSVPYYRNMATFAAANDSIDDMTAAFMCCWERPGASYGQSSITSRRTYANYYDSVLTGGETPEPEPDTYTVTITISGNGTASAEPESAKAGETVTLTETAGDDAEFTGWTVITGDVTITDNSFIMGSADVEILAEFTGETPEPEPEDYSDQEFATLFMLRELFYKRPGVYLS